MKWFRSLTVLQKGLVATAAITVMVVPFVVWALLSFADTSAPGGRNNGNVVQAQSEPALIDPTEPAEATGPPSDAPSELSLNPEPPSPPDPDETQRRARLADPNFYCEGDNLNVEDWREMAACPNAAHTFTLDRNGAEIMHQRGSGLKHEDARLSNNGKTWTMSLSLNEHMVMFGAWYRKVPNNGDMGRAPWKPFELHQNQFEVRYDWEIFVAWHNPDDISTNKSNRPDPPADTTWHNLCQKTCV